MLAPAAGKCKGRSLQHGQAADRAAALAVIKAMAYC
jgi:hypothetical protein